MRLSVVVPVFKDVSSIRALLTRIFMVADCAGYKVEVVIVDDGSGDDAWHELNLVSKDFHGRDIRLIRLARNYGQQIAALCGLRYAKGEFLATMDADLQQRPEDLPLLLKAMESGALDLVYGVGMSGHRALKRILAYAYRALSGFFGATYFNFSSFRVMRYWLGRRLLDGIKTKTLSIDDRLFDIRGRHGVVHVRHEKRSYGRSGYSTWKLVSSVLVSGIYSCRLLPAAARISQVLLLISFLAFVGFPAPWALYISYGLGAFSVMFLISCLILVATRKPLRFEDQVVVCDIVDCKKIRPR